MLNGYHQLHVMGGFPPPTSHLNGNSNVPTNPGPSSSSVRVCGPSRSPGPTEPSPRIFMPSPAAGLQAAPPPSSTSPSGSSASADRGDMTAAISAAELSATPHSNNGPGVAGNGERYSVEYLSQLLKDKKQLAAFPNVFHHLERLADEGDLHLPDPEGETQIFTEKVFVPAKEHPDYNFVGRILGPRGMTAKQLEQETGCKIMVRGRGSMRDKKKEELNRGKPNWEHLNEELHVLIQVEDTANRSKIKLARAVEEIKKLLVPAPEGEDELKRKQLMELAIINGTYRSSSQTNAAVVAQLAAAKQNGLVALRMSILVLQCCASEAAALAQSQRAALLPLQLPGAGVAAAGLAGAPIIMSPPTRTGVTATSQAASIAFAQQHAALSAATTSQAGDQSAASLMAAQQAALLQQQQAQAAVDYQNLILSQQAALTGYDVQTLQAMQYAQAQQQQLSAAGADYSTDFAAAQNSPAAILQQRRVLGGTREHPYKQ